MSRKAPTPRPDLNLLVALDALLAEVSVARAARRLKLSSSAMSRTLARLRAATGDPLLARAGRRMTLTPHAEALRSSVGAAAEAAQAALRPAPGIEIAAIERIFTIRANDGFVENFASRLVETARAAAPRARLRFVPRPDKDVRELREGGIDLDVGVLSDTAPELKAQVLFRDSFVGVARADHPIFRASLTPESYAGYGHVVATRRGALTGPVDTALAALGLTRDIAVYVSTFPAVLAVAATSDLLGLAPRSYVENRRSDGLASFPLPVETPEITISQIWHPRLDADAAHRWLRGLVFEACRGAPTGQALARRNSTIPEKSAPAPPAASNSA